MNDFLAVYDAARVMRCHTVADYSGAPRANLAEHQWGVAVICDYITGGTASAALLRAALLHDIAEHWLGDTPAPTKWRFPYLATAYKDAEREVEQALQISVTLTQEEQTVLRWADALELLIYCVRRGGRPYLAVASNILEAMTELPYHQGAIELRNTLSWHYDVACEELSPEPRK